MDFDLAAKRFARDHSKLRRDAESRQRRGRSQLGVSADAEREAEQRERLARQRAQEKRAKQREIEHQLQFFRDFERSLRVKSLSPRAAASREHDHDHVVAGAAGPLQLSGGFQPTSIHGEGDKLALPPSVLEHLSSLTESSTPWTFRIGILNPEYVFPASPLVRAMKPSARDDGDDTAMNEDEDSDDEEDESARDARSAAYLDELRHKYLAYTHGTVVEFTQEEGQVGLPRTVAAALLAQIRSRNVPARAKRTVDPASNGSGMEVDGVSNSASKGVQDEEEKTAGHLAWGAFDIPDYPIDVTLVELPKGKACTLLPTPQAVQNGFYGLQDIKLVLEQSLVRTRATLSVGDLVHAWNRGVPYDLHVTAVVPSTCNAVVCINTDIEVEFGQQSAAESSESRKQSPPHAMAGTSVGRTLMDSPPHVSALPQATSTLRSASLAGQRAANLRPEPPADQTEGICVVQVRLDRASAKRRFDVRGATVSDLYDFAESALLEGPASSFRLVTRFPRREIERSPTTTRDIRTLADVGIATGQELLIIERM
jgi:hypothetical protein